MKLYAITRITEDHYTWMDVFGVTPNKKVAEAKDRNSRKLIAIVIWLFRSMIAIMLRRSLDLRYNDPYNKS